MKLIDDYDAVDKASMTDNNSSAFCFRYTNNTTRFSNHAKGMAVDINTLYNPFVKEDHFEPKAAEPYLDRTKDIPYYIDENDLAVAAVSSGHKVNIVDVCRKRELQDVACSQWFYLTTNHPFH